MGDKPISVETAVNLYLVAHARTSQDARKAALVNLIEQFQQAAAAQARAEERESCAQIADNEFGGEAKAIATAIRARTDQKGGDAL